MQSDITMSLELPLRVAFVEIEGSTFLLNQTSEVYQANYNVIGHPVLEKIEQLFTAMSNTLRKQ